MFKTTRPKSTHEKNFSVVSSSIFLSKYPPINAPKTPPTHITASDSGSKLGTVFVIMVVEKLVICENKIINNEFLADTFGDIEKK